MFATTGGVGVLTTETIGLVWQGQDGPHWHTPGASVGASCFATNSVPIGGAAQTAEQSKNIIAIAFIIHPLRCLGTVTERTA